jgi:hypothetical protein
MWQRIGVRGENNASEKERRRTKERNKQENKRKKKKKTRKESKAVDAFDGGGGRSGKEDTKENT